MMKKLLIPLSIALAALAGAACTQPVEQPAETGSVELHFSIGEPLTRAVTPGDGTVADGGGIYLDAGVPDLKIFIAVAGNIVHRYPDPSLSPDPANTSTLTSATATLATVKFTGLTPSTTYKVYAFANTGDTSLTVDNAPNWNTVSTTAELDALVFTALGGNNLPSVNDRMPLSAKGTLSVNAQGSGTVDLELLRSLAKVQVTFKNLTASALTLTDCNVSITSINPTQGYVFQPAGDDLTGTQRTLTFPQETLDNISTPEGTKSLNPILVFPSVAELQGGYPRYLCSISFSVGGTPYSFPNLPVHNSLSQDITSLGRNQFLKIEVRISKGQNISFNFEVANWEPKSESVHFD
jgi:hypothetical protein